MNPGISEMQNFLLVIAGLFAAIALMIAALTAAGVVRRRHERTSGGGEGRIITVTNAPSARKCSNCKHFDLEEGQATMRQHKPFLAAAAQLTPSEMGRTIQYREVECPRDGCTREKPIPDCTACQGNGTVNKRIGPEPSSIAAKTKWSDFGACLEHSELRHAGDHCDAFEPREEPPA